MKTITQIIRDYWWLAILIPVSMLVVVLMYDAMAKEQCNRHIDEECVVQYGYYKRDNK